MKYTRRQVRLWVAAAVAVALTPMAIGLAGRGTAERPWPIELGVGIGFVAIGLLALQFVTSGRFARVAPVFGADVVLQFHRATGVAALIFVLVHPVVLIGRDPENLAYFDPRENLLRAVALTTAVVAAIAVVATSLWRERLRLQYEWWRALHGALGSLLLLIGIIHGLQVSRHLGTPWQKVLWTATLGAVLGLFAHSRVIRPWLARRRPYTLVEVAEELPGTTTITVAPVGHTGLRFRAGQFAWISIADTPFSLQQHPFSFSSSAHGDELCFTAKAVGDFTSTWSDLEPGRRVFLEGPYGGFVLDDHAPGAVFVAGGIGITPIMSMIRTLRDTADPRPFLLVYATSRLERAAFADELASAAGPLDLEVVHVLDDPPDDWEGPRGYITEELLDRLLPPDRLAREYFVCGPEPLLDATEQALRALGVSWRRLYTERFQVV